MSDLISRQALIEAMCRECDTEACDGMGRNSMAKCFSVRIVEEQPTACDVGKVVEQINKKIEFAEKQIVKNPADKLDKIVNDAAEDFIEAYKECIEIIRGGGAE